MAVKPRIGPPGAVGGTPVPEMKTNMVSLPTLTTLNATWKFVPAKTGYLLIDTCLSVSSNFETGVGTYLGVSGAPAVVELPFDEFGETGRGVARIFDVTAGVPLTITISSLNTATPINMVLRISDYATERDGQVPDLTFSQANTTYQNVEDLNHQDFQPQRSSTNAYYVDWGADASGHFNVQKTLLGVASCDEPLAIECAWTHARRMAGGTFDYFFWGAEPGPNYPYWNPSYRICYPPYPLGWSDIGGPGSGFGYHYDGNGNSGFGLGYGDAQWYAAHLLARFNFQGIRVGLSTEHIYWLRDQLGDPLAYGGGLNGTGYLATWGTNKVPGTLKKMAFAVDESHDGGANATRFGPLSGVVYVGLGTGTAASGSTLDYTEDDWRSLNFPVGLTETNHYWPGGLAQSRNANRVQSIPPITWTGGLMPWKEIPDDVFAAALEAEKTAGFGMHISMIPKGMESDDPPIPTGVALAAANVAGVDWTRQEQVLLTRFTAEYPDYHVIDWPAFPDSTMLGIGGGPKNADRYFVGRR